MKPGLYLVPLPIGNLGDMSIRAIEVLKDVDEIWAEDTRNLRKILTHFEIEKPSRDLKSCHDHNEHEMAQKLVETVRAERAVAYVSDAGMPLISDPGFRLVGAMRDADLYYTALPGANAVLTALALSGLPSDRFAFLGFVPTKENKRKHFFEEITKLDMSVIAFESPRRLHQSLEAARIVLGDHAQIAMVREISKRFEEVIAGRLDEVLADIAAREVKGEIVLVFGAIEKPALSDAQITGALKDAMTNMSLKEAVQQVSGALNIPRNRVYKIALTLR